uniref:Uncharacterized protein n=1 Tax=Rhizophora mucronata TaxID=61149 RepID=A0A2P2PXP1_RHIMU
MCRLIYELCKNMEEMTMSRRTNIKTSKNQPRARMQNQQEWVQHFCFKSTLIWLNSLYNPKNRF